MATLPELLDDSGLASAQVHLYKRFAVAYEKRVRCVMSTFDCTMDRVCSDESARRAERYYEKRLTHEAHALLDRLRSCWVRLGWDLYLNELGAPLGDIVMDAFLVYADNVRTRAWGRAEVRTNDFTAGCPTAKLRRRIVAARLWLCTHACDRPPRAKAVAGYSGGCPDQCGECDPRCEPRGRRAVIAFLWRTYSWLQEQAERSDAKAEKYAEMLALADPRTVVRGCC